MSSSQGIPTVYLLGVVVSLPLLMMAAFSYLGPFIHKLSPMKISALYVYPIKGLRGVKLDEAFATKHGFKYDRTFTLLKVTPEGFKNMSVGRFPEMTQYLTAIESDGKGKDTLTVNYRAFGDASKAKSLRLPLIPETEKLESMEVNLHGSITQAFKMPEEYQQWFTECFGYEVVFAYLGDNKRDVLFENLKAPEPIPWLSALQEKFPLIKNLIPPIDTERLKITFADCAPYLVTFKTSLDDISSRLPEGEEMDITKFRPNIVIEGSREPWQEDYWYKIQINKGPELIMAHNCVRCQSVNVDYETGKPAIGEAGQVLKKMQKDRRIDIGAKYSPVFGRYSFWEPKTPAMNLRVGDDVWVTKVVEGHTVFCWPGLA